MNVRTNKFGQTTIRLSREDITQATTVDMRVTKACAEFGLSERGSGRTRNRAVALIHKHPALTAEQAVEVVLANRDR